MIRFEEFGATPGYYILQERSKRDRQKTPQPGHSSAGIGNPLSMDSS